MYTKIRCNKKKHNIDIEKFQSIINFCCLLLIGFLFSMGLFSSFLNWRGIASLFVCVFALNASVLMWREANSKGRSIGDIRNFVPHWIRFFDYIYPITFFGPIITFLLGRYFNFYQQPSVHILWISAFTVLLGYIFSSFYDRDNHISRK